MNLIFIFLCVLYVVNGAPLGKIMVDMTYPYDENTINYPMWKKFEMTVVLNGTIGTSWVQGEEMASATHMGTHMDAPSHFSAGGLNIDQIPISKFIAPAAVISIEDRAAEDREALVTVEDLENWERVTHSSLNGKIVLFRSGWGKKWHDRADFLGTEENDTSKLRFPGISREAAQWLVDNRDINGIGMDTISFDKGSSTDFPAHNILLGHGIFGLENVANMEHIPIYGATLYVMPMKIKNASGAPTRVIATYPRLVYSRKIQFHPEEFL